MSPQCAYACVLYCTVQRQYLRPHMAPHACCAARHHRHVGAQLLAVAGVGCLLCRRRVFMGAPPIVQFDPAYGMTIPLYSPLYSRTTCTAPGPQACMTRHCTAGTQRPCVDYDYRYMYGRPAPSDHDDSDGLAAHTHIALARSIAGSWGRRRRPISHGVGTGQILCLWRCWLPVASAHARRRLMATTALATRVSHSIASPRAARESATTQLN